MPNREFKIPSAKIGETIEGVSRAVFWDTHSAISQNNPPTALVTGGPGSGKTFFALTVTTINAILGKTVVALDPKGDFLKLLELQNQIGPINVWDLNKPENNGILDPFYMSNTIAGKTDLALNIIEIFLGELTPSAKTAIAPHVKDMANNPRPSLYKLTTNLRRQSNPEARNVATTLDLLAELPFSSLCFKKDDSPRPDIVLDQGLTIVSLLGITLPKEGHAPENNKERLASGIMFLITNFLKETMMNKSKNSIPKLIVIDEAHAVLSSDAGARTISDIARLGRSLNTALILVTQNNSDIKRININNTISTRFAFKTKIDDARQIVQDMELPNLGYENRLTNFSSPGQCLMQDSNKKYSIIQITRENKEWADAFETNPLAKFLQEDDPESEEEKTTQ